MSWANPESDLRTQLSDNSKDKHCYRKRVFGEYNGINTRFKTLEFRRVGNFAQSDSTQPDFIAPPLGVYKNGVLLSPADFAFDNPETGDFQLQVAPVDGDLLEASYYAQWFNKEEIEQFLRMSTNWLSLGDDYSNMIPGLRPSLLKYAQAEAYQKLSARWAQMLSEQYLVSDAQEKGRFSIVDTWMKASKAARDEAYKSRDDFYDRSGQQKIPYASSIQGRVTDPVPRR